MTDLTVGRRLRLLRQKRERSLQELTTSTDLSIGLISQIERGLSSPSQLVWAVGRPATAALGYEA